MHMRTSIMTTILMVALCFTVSVATAAPEISKENVAARKNFAEEKFGIFLHWGIYSMYAQGEWYQQKGKLDRDEYGKASRGFYPSRFDAEEWVKAFKDAGVKYITFTSRHHDGFSMFDTKYSDFDIMDATPFKRDILKELADACHKYGIKLHIYYSLMDWKRTDYPIGRTNFIWEDNAEKTPVRTQKGNYDSYFSFMKNQLTEILTNYGEIGAIWFDGEWDHSKDVTPFDWRFDELYAHIHKLQPGCLVGNNHHHHAIDGEDFQIFERDLPGENKAGLSKGQKVSENVPLEMCQTMNGMWGYKIADRDYKSVKDCVRLIIEAAGKNANLLLNIGPQPDGELPVAALQRLKGIGKWLAQYGETIYGTTASGMPKADWGISVRKDKRIYLHVLDTSTQEIDLPVTQKIKAVYSFENHSNISFKKNKEGISIQLPPLGNSTDNIFVVELK